MKRLALISVYDKKGLEQLGRGLAGLGFGLVASGGTARALQGFGLEVQAVDELTGFPSLLDGRVKTLHPAVAGGILARRTPEHLAELEQHGIAPIDVVVCNLYPFSETVARQGVSEQEAIEEIDIGGVTLLRAAAKNNESVTVVCDPADYPAVLEALTAGEVSLPLRRRMALKAFQHTAAYDAAIAGWLGEVVEGGEALPEFLGLAARRLQVMRYGENPHQQAALYAWAGQEPVFKQLSGKELSYNNLVDLDAACAIPREFAEPTVAIIKHTNPCGLASADNLVEAFQMALDCDPISAFGSIIATNREVDVDLVKAIGKLFVEVLVAPSYTEKAAARLAKRKKKCRVVIAGQAGEGAPIMRSVRGGILVQQADVRGVDQSTWNVVTKRQPTEEERGSLAFAWLAAKHVKSNAIVFARGKALVGVGAGQMNRVDSVFLAARRAGDKARGAVMGSDAFFALREGVETAAAAGITAIIQPGGSIRDEQVIEAADRLGLAMVFTGERHFRH